MKQLDGERLLQLEPGRSGNVGEHSDLRQYLNIVYRRKWLILIFAFAVTGAVFALLSRVVPIYRATATVMVESQSANVVSIPDIYGVDARGTEYYLTQFEIMKSRPVVEAVVDRLHLEKSPQFARAQGAGANAGTAIVDQYLGNLRVSPIPRTQLVKISFDSPDPVAATDIINAHAESFIDNYLAAKEGMTHSATQWLGGRIEELRAKLNESEQRLQAFKEREHVVDVEGFQALPARQLNELTSKLIDARRDLSQTRNTYTQIEQVRDAALEEKLAVPAIRSDPLVQQLRQARNAADLKVAELSKRYGPMHPKMRAAVSERTETEQALARQVESVMDSIKNEHDVRRNQEQSIEAAVDSTKADVQLVGRKESAYRTLQREVETNRQLFDMFYKRMSETAETGSLDSANARIIERASVPLAPIGPKKNLVIALSALISAVVGVIIAFALELLNNTLRHSVDIERKLGVPTLALIPALRRKSSQFKSPAQEFGTHGHREFSEAIRTLRTSVALSSLDSTEKLILVTSSLAGEGKTTVACNLALAFGPLERILLIDGDLRRPSVASELELLDCGPGLADLCAGTAKPGECVIHSDRYHIDILAAGTLPSNPQELLSSRRLQQALMKLKPHYDRIIIDGPPALPVSDALLLANCVDVLVYVVKAESTTVAQAKAGMRKFQHAPAMLMGAVLNQVNAKKLEAYGEYGGGYYGRYEHGRYESGGYERAGSESDRKDASRSAVGRFESHDRVDVRP